MQGYDELVFYCSVNLLQVSERFNPFYGTGLFLYSRKASESRGFLIFSGGMETDQWHVMGYFGFRLDNVRIISLKSFLEETRIQV